MKKINDKKRYVKPKILSKDKIEARANNCSGVGGGKSAGPCTTLTS